MSHKLKELPVGEFGVIMVNDKGGASQVALTEEQNILFKAFITIMSKERPLVKLPQEYDLVLESSKYIPAIG